ncbi:unnamed protein product [Caenorhabditis angaria]|uniref:Uncharacterized protein n=1 Tax=Caenorhabditis angaria TaxID=860376 RepID=A0A9P1NAY4_9PELO|nr:unnamed protein product [Caenorhabditis angaria]
MSTCSDDLCIIYTEHILKWIEDLERVPEMQDKFSKLMVKVWKLDKKTNKHENEFYYFFTGLKRRIEEGKSIELRTKHFQHKNISYHTFLQEVMKKNNEVVEFFNQKLLEHNLPHDLQNVVVPAIIEFLTEEVHPVELCRLIQSLVEDVERLLTDHEFRKDFPKKYIHGESYFDNYILFLFNITPRMCTKCGY